MTDAHFSCTDQAPFHQYGILEHDVVGTLHAPANSSTGANTQVAPHYDVAGNDLPGLNLEVTVVPETTRPPGSTKARVRRGGRPVLGCTPGFYPGRDPLQRGERRH